MNYCEVSIGNCSLFIDLLFIDLLLESVIVKTVILNF